MFQACISGNREQVLSRIKLGKDKDWNNGLYASCMKGQKDLALLMIEYGADDWNYALYFACRGGHKDLALLMMEKGANDWNWALNGACEGGHIDLVTLMIDKYTGNFEQCLAISCEHGHKEVALLMIQKGAKNFNRGLTISCYNNHIDLVKTMIQHGATNLNAGISFVWDIDIVLLLLEKGANIDDCRIQLKEDHIYYLLDKIYYMGKYTPIADLCIKKRILADQILKELNMTDVNTIIYTY